MKRTSLLFIALSFVACGTDASNGEGTTTTSGAAGGTCPGECCPKAPYPCRDLDEATCQSRSDCQVVKGAELGTDGPQVYLGCSSCQIGGSYQTCVIDPAKPGTCYKVQSELVPDGWTEDFECQACSSGGGS